MVSFLRSRGVKLKEIKATEIWLKKEFGIAYPLLKPAMKSKNHVIEILVQVIEELKVAMFLCGCADIRSVKNIPVVVTGNTRQWLEGRDFDIK